MKGHRTDPLTDKQCGIAIDIANGRNVKEIGISRGCSPKTIEFHRSKIVKRLNIKCGIESFLARYMIKLGYIIV